MMKLPLHCSSTAVASRISANPRIIFFVKFSKPLQNIDNGINMLI